MMNAVIIPEKFNKVQEITKMYLTTLEQTSSDSTFKNYLADIKQFFQLVKDKELEFLTKEDVKLSVTEIDLWRLELRNKGNKGSTINRKIASLKGYYRTLSLHGIDTEGFHLLSMMKGEKVIRNHHDAITMPEVHLILESLETTYVRKYSHELKWLLKLGVDTGIRFQELKNIKWSQFSVLQTTVNLYVTEKNNKDNNNNISLDFYEEMCTELSKEEEKIFPLLTDKKVRMFMEHVNNLINKDRTRNISFHSFKNSAVTEVYNRTKDITAAQKMAGHSNVATTNAYITGQERKPLGAFSYNNGAEDLYNKVDLDVLMLAINNMNDANKAVLNEEINKICKIKELY